MKRTSCWRRSIGPGRMRDSLRASMRGRAVAAWAARCSDQEGPAAARGARAGLCRTRVQLHPGRRSHSWPHRPRRHRALPAAPAPDDGAGEGRRVRHRHAGAAGSVSGARNYHGLQVERRSRPGSSSRACPRSRSNCRSMRWPGRLRLAACRRPAAVGSWSRAWWTSRTWREAAQKLVSQFVGRPAASRARRFESHSGLHRVRLLRLPRHLPCERG